MRGFQSIAAAGDGGGHRQGHHGAGFGWGRNPSRNSGHNPDVLSIYDTLQRQGSAPGVGVVLAALRVCRDSRDVHTGKRIHSYIAERTNYCSSNSVVANALVDMYAKCGSMDDARQVFASMNRRDVVSWTSMIMGYAKCGDGELALKYFSGMREEGCEPDRVTVIAAVKACSSCADKEEARVIQSGKSLKWKALEQGRALHSWAARAGVVRDIVVANSLVDMYSKCGSMEDARDVFERMRERDVVSWTSIILGYAQTGEPELALELYSRMQDDRQCVPDRVTFLAALKACSSLAEREGDSTAKQKSLEKGRDIHSKAATSSNQLDHFVENSLLDLYAKCGSMEDATILFQAMSHHSSISWKCMVLGYVHNGDFEQALAFYDRMRSSGCSVDRVTLLAALKACSTLAAAGAVEEASGAAEEDDFARKRQRYLKTGASIHSSFGAEPLDLAVANSLIDLYTKCGCMELARSLFESLPRKSSISWNCIILGYALCGKAAVSLELYESMRLADCVPDAGTFVAVLKACSILSALEVGRQISLEAYNAGLDTVPLVANALLDFFAKCGSMLEAEEVFSSTSKKDVLTWSSLIAGYSSQGDAARALELFSTMEETSDVKPDSVTFLAVLTACSHSGLVEKAQEFFEAMSRKYSIAPTIQHYTCMVELLGRANRLEEAMKMIQEMRCKPDVVIWQALLGACWKWKDLRIGRLAFESLIQLDDRNASAYVLMANLYAEAGMVEDATRLMKFDKNK